MNNYDIKTLALLGLNIREKGRPQSIAKYFHDVLSDETTDRYEGLVRLGLETVEDLDRHDVDVVSVHEKGCRHFSLLEANIALFVKGNTKLIKKKNIKAMHGINRIKDANRIINEESMKYTLMFKQDEIDGLEIPKNSIIYIDNDFLGNTENIDPNKCYVGMVLKDYDEDDERMLCSTLVFGLIGQTESILNDVIDKKEEFQLTSHERSELMVINMNYGAKTLKRDRVGKFAYDIK